MKNNERYKRLIKTCAAVIIVAVEVLLYWCVWTGYYNRIIEIPFWRRGNWLIVGLYGAILLFFLNTYGGLRIGYLRHGNLIYSQMLSIVLVNIFAYLELVLIDKKLYAPAFDSSRFYCCCRLGIYFSGRLCNTISTEDIVGCLWG